MKRIRPARLAALLVPCWLLAAAAADEPAAAVTNAAPPAPAVTNAVLPNAPAASNGPAPAAGAAMPGDGTALPERPDRNPFWPVGHDPSAAAALAAAATPGTPEPPPKPPVPAADWDGARQLVRIEGLSRSSSGKSVAIINGKVWQAGDSLAVEYKGRQYRWIIRSIGDKGVDLSRAETPPEATP